MKTVKALREIYYNDKTRNTGDVFEMSDDHAQIFCGVGWAQLAPSPAPPDAPASTAVLPQAPSPTDAAIKPVTAPPPHKRGYYRKRDMRAGK